MKGFKRYERYKDSGVEWIGEIPEHWHFSRFKNFVKVINEKIEGNETNNNLQYVGLENIESFTGKLIEGTSENFGEGISNIFYSTDVLFGKLRPYLAKVLLPSINGRCSTELLVFRPIDNSLVDRTYLYYYCLSDGFINVVNSSTYGVRMPRANWDFISLLPFTVPSLREQQAITNFLDQKTAKIDSLIADKEKLIELLQEQRQAIITQAVTKGLDPNVPMKDSGIEWVGEIPEHWEVVPLFKAFSEHQHKNTNNKEDNVLSLSYGKIIRRNIETNYGLLPESFETYNVVQPGFIVLRLTDLQNDKHSLRCGLVKEKGIITSAYVTIKKRCNDVNPSYFYYLLHGYDLLKVFYNMGGGVRQSLKYNELKRMPIVVPNECEQKTIAEFLDKKTSELDNLILEMKLQIEKLREYRQSLITAAVTGKIDVRDYIVDNDKEEGEEQEEVS